MLRWSHKERGDCDQNATNARRDGRRKGQRQLRKKIECV